MENGFSLISIKYELEAVLGLPYPHAADFHEGMLARPYLGGVDRRDQRVEVKCSLGGVIRD